MTSKTAEQLALMRRAGRVVAEMHEICSGSARAGVTTAALDRVASAVLERRGAVSNLLGYQGFPAVSCVSVNDEVVHGVPGDRVLNDGDIVSIDCGAIVDGWHADAAVTVAVGDVDDESRRLLAVTRDALGAQIEAVVAGAHLGDIGASCEEVARAAGLSVVEDYTGHGIGRAMHEPPEVPNFGQFGHGPVLSAGQVLAIEPMVTLGGGLTRVSADGWTVVTEDGRRAAHFEHTVAVGESGPEILTAP